MTQTRPRRRPLTHQEKLALQERKQRRREKMEESRELAKGPIDLTFCLLVMLLTAIGLVILLSASFPSAYYEKAPSRHNPLYYFEKQGVFAVLGTAVMLLVSKFNYQRLRGAGRALIYVSVIFLILVIIPHNKQISLLTRKQPDHLKLDLVDVLELVNQNVGIFFLPGSQNILPLLEKLPCIQKHILEVNQMMRIEIFVVLAVNSPEHLFPAVRGIVMIE